MPGRRYTGRPPQTQPEKPHRSQRKQRKRAQNALAVAEAEEDETLGIRRSRLGHVEQDFRKRQREENEDSAGSEDDEDGGQRKRPRNTLRDRYGDDAEYGSDSEGNEWVTGQVNDEDDESLDSDEAFGESDEERFEGFTFRGSKSNKPKAKKVQNTKDLLDEDDEEDEASEDLDSDAESDNFAENAVDLHTMLDGNYSNDESESEDGSRRKPLVGREPAPSRDEEPSSEEESDFEEQRSELEFSDEDDDDDADGLAASMRSEAIQKMVAGLGPSTSEKALAKKARDDAQEALAPSGLLLIPKTPAENGDSSAPKSKQSTKGKVDVPLPQRQQGRLDRAAAFEKANETLGRWIDTVKHNRRAEHLSFPLINRDELSAKNTDRFKPLDMRKPQTDLEAAIQDILVQNGMDRKDTQSDDENQEDLEMEGAPEPGKSVQDILAERAELRKARDLLFREEIKAKRIKKIKSKSYRRVHRKARERELQRQQEIDAANGVLPMEDDQERLDRLRAEERMGAKHRDSKWAKAMKATGRSMWDDDARNGMVEMAQKEEELKKRILGQTIGDDGSDADDSDSGGDSNDDEGLRDNLFKLRDEPETTGRGSKLSNMAFMKRAEEAQRRQNEETIAQIQRDLDGRDTSEEDSDEEGPARRKYGIQKNGPLPLRNAANRSEFEEREGSEVEDFDRDEDDSIKVTVDREPAPNGRSSDQPNGNSIGKRRNGLSQQQPTDLPEEIDTGDDWMNTLEAEEKQSRQQNPADVPEKVGTGNDWMDLLPVEQKKSRHKRPQAVDVLIDNDIDPEAGIPKHPVRSEVPPKEYPPPKALQKQIRLLPITEDDGGGGDGGGTSSSGSDSESEARVPRLSSQRSALQRAFAGDEVAASFEEEKALVASAERSPSPAADILPGWGAWTGTGLTKRDRKDRQRREQHLQQQARNAWMAAKKGAKNGKKIDQTRKDARLDNVIISEKRMPARTTSKYLAGTLPHPFENRAQYERSLRLPVGPEWTTKQTFQSATKPRVLLGGGVIKPMEKPTI